MRNDDFYLSMIKKSPLIFKIRQSAPKFFLLWKEMLPSEYRDRPFNPNSEEIISDMEECFASSLRSLFEKEREAEKSEPWKIGYVSGFFTAKAFTRWSYRYIYVETKEYKQLMMLKTLINYLELDVLARSKIEKIYQCIIDEKPDILGQNKQFDEKIISLKDFKNKRKTDIDGKFWDSLSRFLWSIVEEKYDISFKKVCFDDSPETDSLFANTDIQLLIEYCKDNLQKK